jgi:hypothetical protein
MLVVDVESLARRHARSVQAILFTVTAEPTLERPIPELRTLTGQIHHDASLPGLARQANEGVFVGAPAAVDGP